MDSQIFWLASYPKSGNTLLRSILVSLFFTKDGKFNLSHLKFIDQFDNTNNIIRNKNIFGKDFDKINKIEIFYKYINELQSKKVLNFKEDFKFLKTHSGLFKIKDYSFTSINNTRGIIYVLRDPRDVCISWSKHRGISLDESIDFVCSDHAVFSWKDTNQNNLHLKKIPKSYLSSWEKHVISWTSTKWKIPILIIKFEDLVYYKKETIDKIVNFFVRNYNFNFINKNNKIKNILETTDFLKLSKEEDEKGFDEGIKNTKFFSVGRKNQWINKLNKSQIKKIETKFSKIMKMYNYKLAVEF